MRGEKLFLCTMIALTVFGTIGTSGYVAFTLNKSHAAGVLDRAVPTPSPTLSPQPTPSPTLTLQLTPSPTLTSQPALQPTSTQTASPQATPSGLPPANVPFVVYADYGDANSHYSAATLTSSGKTPPTDETIDYNWTGNPYQGTTCIKAVYSNPKYEWVGGEFLEPTDNWGTQPNAGYNLSRAHQLSFRVRGNSGRERVQFMMGGAGYNDANKPVSSYPDSSPIVMSNLITLTTQWQQVTIPLTGDNLTGVIDGFGWDVDTIYNQSGATFYLDDIVYS